MKKEHPPQPSAFVRWPGRFSLASLMLVGSACVGTPPDEPTEVTVTLSPASVTLETGASEQFSVTVTGSTDTTVLWSIDEASGCGTLSAGGLYVAPDAAATCHVTATSVADDTRSDTATVTVEAAASDCPCPGDSTGAPYCSGNAVYQDVTTWECVSETCVDTSTPELVVTCPGDSTGAEYCDTNGDVYADVTTWACIGGACVNTVTPTLVSDCGADSCPLCSPPTTWRDGLLGEWKLDGDATDTSGEGNHGVASAGLFTSSNCASGQCALFDEGADEVALPTFELGTTAEPDAAYAFWVYVTDKSAERNILTHTAGNVSRIFVDNDSLVGEAKLIIETDTDEPYLDGLWTVTLDEIQHVVLSREGDVIALYLNSVLRGRVVVSGAAPLTLSYVGGRSGDSNSFRGTLDEVMIWNRALTDCDVRRLYDSFSGGCLPDCSGRVCGDDGCGCSCEPGCPPGEACDASGQCLTAVHPNSYVDQTELDAIRAKVLANEEPWKSAHTALILAADDALTCFDADLCPGGVYTVTAAPSGTGHDYWSQGPYCGWSSRTKDSCYLANPTCVADNLDCCDGCYNDLSDRWDYKRAMALSESLRNLGLAYQLATDPGDAAAYAERAVALIHAWALDPATSMTPSYTTNFQPRIELSITMPGMFYGADLIYDYPGWDEQDRADFLAWVAAFAESAKTWSESNNFENWRNVAIASAGALLDDPSLLSYAFDNFELIIPSQVDSEGKLVRELSRTKSLEYSLYALNAMVQTAEIARHRGVDLYDYTCDGTRGLRLVVDFYATYSMDSQSTAWRDLGYLQIEPIDKRDNMALYELVHSHWQDPDHLAVINHWGRPLEEVRIMGFTTLSHGNRFDL